jgi:hypothetical protein
MKLAERPIRLSCSQQSREIEFGEVRELVLAHALSLPVTLARL